MKFATALASICFTLAAALPAQVEERQAYVPCPAGIYSNARCCDRDAFGIPRIGCSTPSDTPTNAANFRDICAEKGEVASCCVTPLFPGSEVVCDEAPGV
ncbi:magnaporin [Chaetomium fimeti]|uniref:Magnaporin n=1 Tax=Chaetomium fimeti TaxID=1854472 RepID=A0AAE0HAI6_9PEZI|nr:magnaporin [Chaetomium fimeti]